MEWLECERGVPFGSKGALTGVLVAAVALFEVVLLAALVLRSCGVTAGAFGVVFAVFGLPFGVILEQPTGLVRNGDEERREEIERVGERGPIAPF